jgi:hypothetical protein
MVTIIIEEKITHNTTLLQERIHTPAPNQKSSKPGKSQSRHLKTTSSTIKTIIVVNS